MAAPSEVSHARVPALSPVSDPGPRLGCGGRSSAPPATSASPLTAQRRVPTISATVLALRRRAILPSLQQTPPFSFADTVAELKVAADSAADEAVLDELAEAHPEGDDAEARSGDVSPEGDVPGGAEELAAAVTWDIDVETFNSHDRVRYYLDFFQGRGRERMAIWLTRMPRYEADDSGAASAREPPRRPGLSRADRERFLQHRHQPRQGGWDVAVHEGDR